MDREALRAFATRDRAAVDDSKRAYHARRHRESGGEAGFVAGQALWLHARRIQPEWPDAEQRDADLAHHIALKQALDRAAHAVARR